MGIAPFLVVLVLHHYLNTEIQLYYNTEDGGVVIYDKGSIDSEYEEEQDD